MLVDELLAYIFNEPSHILAQPMATWLAASRRFTAFTTTFRDKIRKKIRTTQDEESLLDLWLELETAYRLLQEKRLSLEYEPLQSGKTRSPDFAVTFTTSLTFMVEVTRLRAEQKNTEAQAQIANLIPATPLIDERLADTICDKLGQLLPQRSNVLLVGVEALSLTDSDLYATMIHIQQRAERNEAAFWQRYGFRDRSDFFRYYQRLSEVLVRGKDLEEVGQTAVCSNPQAKHPLPSKVRTALYRSHGV
jgi:hypothetical protein